MKIYISLDPEGYLDSWGTSPNDGTVEFEVETFEEAAGLSKACQYTEGAFVLDEGRLQTIIAQEQEAMTVPTPEEALRQENEVLKTEVQKANNRVDLVEGALMDFIMMSYS